MIKLKESVDARSVDIYAKTPETDDSSSRVATTEWVKNLKIVYDGSEINELTVHILHVKESLDASLIQTDSLALGGSVFISSENGVLRIISNGLNVNNIIKLDRNSLEFAIENLTKNGHPILTVKSLDDFINAEKGIYKRKSGDTIFFGIDHEDSDSIHLDTSSGKLKAELKINQDHLKVTSDGVSLNTEQLDNRWVNRSGDTITGDLEIQGKLHVHDELKVGNVDFFVDDNDHFETSASFLVLNRENQERDQIGLTFRTNCKLYYEVSTNRLVIKYYDLGEIFEVLTERNLLEHLLHSPPIKITDLGRKVKIELLYNAQHFELVDNELRLKIEFLDNNYAKIDLSNVDKNTFREKIKQVDGSGSGIDADLLDGLDSTQFIRSDVDYSFLGTLIYAGPNRTVFNYKNKVFQVINPNDFFIGMNWNETGNTTSSEKYPLRIKFDQNAGKLSFELSDKGESASVKHYLSLDHDGLARWTGDLQIDGNLNVLGDVTTLNTQQLLIEDNIITLNSNVTSGNPTLDAGIEVSRGDLPKAQLIWDETEDTWKIGIENDLKTILTKEEMSSYFKDTDSIRFETNQTEVKAHLKLENTDFLEITHEGLRLKIEELDNRFVNKSGDSLTGVFDLSESLLYWTRDTDRAQIKLVDYGTNKDWLTIEFFDDIDDRVRFRWKGSNQTEFSNIFDVAASEVISYVPFKIQNVYLKSSSGSNVSFEFEDSGQLNIDETSTAVQFGTTKQKIEFTKPVSFLADNSPPFSVISSEKVDNLNADLLDGKHASDLADISLSNVSDQTILNKIKNVDGSGSGLDADLLDGKDSNYFFQLNEHARASNWSPKPQWQKVGGFTISFDYGKDTYIALDNGGSRKVHLVIDGDVYANEGQKQLAYNDLTNVSNQTILNKIKTVDGSGSGLDADLLDGKHANEFALSDLSNIDDQTILNKIKNVDGPDSGLDADKVDGIHGDAFLRRDIDNGPVSDNSITLGSENRRFKEIYAVFFNGTALRAKYADFAEYYTAPEKYEPGTVVSVSSDPKYEVEISNMIGDLKAIGVVSENPGIAIGYDENKIPVALKGKVKCKVLCPVKKGDPLIAFSNGVAVSVRSVLFDNINYKIIGYALESCDEEKVKLIKILLS